MKMKRIVLFFAIFVAVIAVQAQNVGISDQIFTPNTRLHVRGDAGNNVTLTVERTSATTSALLFIPDNNFTTIQSQATATSTVARAMRFNVGTTEAMRIIVGGNVGIGTTTPTALLDVNGSVLGHYYRTYANNTDYSMFTRNGGGSAVYINQIDAISPILRLSSGTATANSNVVMTVENNGSVGLGVLAPTARLHVNGTVRFQGLNTLSGFTTALVVDVNGNVQARSLNNVAFNGYTETDPTAWRLTGNAALSTNFIGTTNAIDFRMFTNNAERMRITSAGNVGIGTTAPTALLHVVGRTNIVHSTSPSLYVQNDANSFTNLAIQVFSQGSQRAFIASNGGAFFNGNVGIGTTNPTYKLHVIGRFKSDGINETSDARLKKNIEPLQNSLDKILAMQGVTYEWNKEGMEEGVQIGLIAQEVEKILPEIVDTDSEGYKSIQYSVLVAVLIEAMKDQQEEYEDLLQKVQQMEGDLEAIKAMLGIEDDKVSR